MISKNVHLLPARKLSAWRKISLGSWRPNGDSQVYCELRVNAEPAMKKIAELNATSQNKITITHYVGLVMGQVLKEVPDLNALVRLGNIYPRRDVDIFFHVVYQESELSGHVVRNIDQKKITEIACDLNYNIKSINTGDDLNFKKIKKSWNFIPAFLSKHVLDFIGFINYTLNLSIKSLGVPRDCFGSMMITNIGSLGFSSAFVPLAPYSHIPFVMALGKVEKKAVARDDGVLYARDELGLCCTFDHRIMDGARGARMSGLIHKYFNHPEFLGL